MGIWKEDDHVLEVKMFGDFSISWNGKILVSGKKKKRTQFVSLLQMVLYHGREGITCAQLENILFENRKVKNTRHALRTVIYNARLCLREYGLPEADYFVRKKDRIFWTPEIAVQSDTDTFVSLIEQSRDTDDPGKRLRLLLEACGCYSGEFLKGQTEIPWVAEKSEKYRKMFLDCVEQAANLLRAAGDFAGMEKLGRLAARAQPCKGWETFTMEELLDMGRMEEEWEQFYLAETDAIREESMCRLERISAHADDPSAWGYAALNRIRDGLQEDPEEIRGGYYCPYPVFRGIYRLVGRMMDLNRLSSCLLLCILVDQRGSPMKEGSRMEKLSSRLLDAVRASVRRGDVVSRCGKGQYVVLLIGTARKDCDRIIKRISDRFAPGSGKTGVEYFAERVICPADSG